MNERISKAQQAVEAASLAQRLERVITTSPAEILRYHTDLADRFLHPSQPLANFLAYHMAEVIEKSRRGRMFETAMFWPILPLETRGEDVRIEHGAALARKIGGALARSVTYEITAEMMTAMRGLYANALPPELVDEAEMPERNGFAWFDTPWQVGNDPAFVIRAISWDFMEIFTNFTGQEEAWPTVRFSLWRHELDAPPDENINALKPLGPLAVTHTAPVPLNIVLHKPDPERDAPELAATDSFLGLIHLLWMLLGMEIVATPKAPIPRHAQRRAARTLKYTGVNVVLLRRISHPSGEPAGTRLVDWQCRWPVQGHWRHHEAPPPLPDGSRDHHHGIDSGKVNGGGDKLCMHCDQPIHWVRPYLKGPDNKPLRATEKTLIKLAR